METDNLFKMIAEMGRPIPTNKQNSLFVIYEQAMEKKTVQKSGK